MVGNIKNISRLSNQIRKITQFKVLLFVFVIGIIYGSLLLVFNKVPNTGQLFTITQQFINKRAEQSIVYTFIGSLNSSLVLILLLFLLGFFALGQPFSIFIPLFHGLGLGLSITYLYQTIGVKGLLYTLILILPAQIICTLALILAARESLRFSNKIFRLLIPSRYDEVITDDLKLYILRFLVIILIIISSSIVDTLCTFFFAKFF